MSDNHNRYVGIPSTASSNQMVRDIYNSLKHLQLREGAATSMAGDLQTQSSFEQQLALGAGNINALTQGIPRERSSFPRATKAVALEEIRKDIRPFAWPSSTLPSNGLCQHKSNLQNFKSSSVTDLHQQGYSSLPVDTKKFSILSAAGYDQELILEVLQNHPEASLETLRELLNLRMTSRSIPQQRLYGIVPQNSRVNPTARLPSTNPSVYQQPISQPSYVSSHSSNNSYQSMPTSQYIKQRPIENLSYASRLNEQRHYAQSAMDNVPGKYIPYQPTNFGDRQYPIQSADSYSYDKKSIPTEGWKKQSSTEHQQNVARQQVIDAVTLRSKPESRKVSQTKRYSKELSNYDHRNSMEAIPNKPPPPYPGYQSSFTRVTSHDSSSAEVVQPNHAPITVIFDEKNDKVNVIGGIPDGYEKVASSTPSSGQSSPHSTLKDPPLYNFPTSHQNAASKPVTQQVTSFYSANPDGQTTQQYFHVNKNIPYPVPATEQQFKPISESPQQFKPINESLVRRERGSPPPYPGSKVVKQISVNSDDMNGLPNTSQDSSSSSKKTSTVTEPGSVSFSDSSASTSPTPDDVERSYSPLPAVSNNTFKTMVIHAEKKENQKPSSAKDNASKEPVMCRLKNYTPQAYKFYMEQHVENILKLQEQRKRRRRQLEIEMERARLPKKEQEEMIKLLAQKESNHMRLRRAKMEKSMFTKVKTIGVGAFGEVSLVRKNGTDAYYAMKTLRKSEVLRRNQVAHVKAERDILAEADSEWVVKLYYSFQDEQNLYFVMQYVPGGDLMALLIKFGIFSEELAKFYIAELVLAIESVHKLGFIHRDIKPDNVLIDRHGHIKLTDFGLCTGFRWTHDSKYYLPESEQAGHVRQYSMEPEGGWESLLNDADCNCSSHRLKYDLCKPLERRRLWRHMRCQAHSLVGTPNYIAPEVLLRIPYGQQCDWWSVGVILYEMVVGQPPFVARSPAETQWKVINWQDTLHIPPSRPLPPNTKDIILRLCTSPDDRIGRDGADDIKRHPYFSDINFHSIHTEQAPYVPQIKNATDTSNFDPVPENMSTDNTENGENYNDHELIKKGPGYAFYEFTFRHFFDDGGHANPFYERHEKKKEEPRPRALNHGSKRSAPAANKSMTVPNKIPVPNVSTAVPEEKQPIYV